MAVTRLREVPSSAGKRRVRQSAPTSDPNDLIVELGANSKLNAVKRRKVQSLGKLRRGAGGDGLTCFH